MWATPEHPRADAPQPGRTSPDVREGLLSALAPLASTQPCQPHCQTSLWKTVHHSGKQRKNTLKLRIFDSIMRQLVICD
ncbi:hypothetical protein RHEC894_CH02734 [Rhizobium sp. CIAT894]|nr:hypothetical protein RHEC894_CH02734 [Rhizobium sp. CIAT894]